MNIQQTSGTFTATKDGTVFSADPNRLQIYETNAGGIAYWVITGTRETAPSTSEQIAIYLPQEGNVSNKTYRINEDSADKSAARAAWWEIFGSNNRYWTAYEGEVTVTVNQDIPSIVASFRFNAGKPTDKVVIERGALDLSGRVDRQAATAAAGSATAEISGRGIIQFVATEVSSYGGVAIDFPPHQIYRAEQKPATPMDFTYVMALEIADGLPSGTYDFSPGSQHVRALYMEYQPIEAFHAHTGSITLTFSPQRDLVASFDFEGRRSDGQATMGVSNGRLTFNPTSRA